IAALHRACYRPCPMQREPPQVSVVIPLYNEEQNVAPLLDELFAHLARVGRTFEVICVDDGSRDATYAELQAWAAREPRLRAIRGVRLHDYGCSLKAYRREVLQGVKLYGEMHRFIPIYASWQGASVTEMEVNHRVRRAGASKYGFSRTIKVLLDLMVVKFLAS